jgi:hypothetical protein
LPFKQIDLTKERKIRMKNIRQRIDWSVKPIAESTSIWSSRKFTIKDKAEALKAALVKKLSEEYAEVGSRLVYQAVNEAHALAALTTVPLLVLPSLAEEKVQKVAAWTAHQRVLLGSEQVAFAA